MSTSFFKNLKFNAASVLIFDKHFYGNERDDCFIKSSIESFEHMIIFFVWNEQS